MAPATHRCRPITSEAFSLDAIPEEVLVVTAGIDVQDDRLEITLTGWNRAGDALILDHLQIWGSPDDDSTWGELDALLRSKWRHPWGGQIGIDGAVIDSGAWTQRVYDFCFPRLARRIWAGKGVAGHHPIFAPSRGKVKGARGRLFIIGVDTIKTTIINRLVRGQSIRFASHLESEYFNQLASERKVVRYSRGQPIVRFERKVGARAEALDCLCYAFAARHGAQVQLERRESDLRMTARTPKPVVREEEPSLWGQRERDWWGKRDIWAG